MKNLSALFLISLLFSCTEKKENSRSENILENLTFELDTIHIDPGNELIDLSGILLMEYDGADQLYVFQEKTAAIQEIDLQENRLINSFHFEREGPDGIGSFISNIQALPNKEFAIISYETQGVYNSAGQQQTDLSLSTFMDSQESDESLPIPFEMRVSQDGKQAYALVGDFLEGSWSFARADLVTKHLKSWEMPEFLAGKSFTITLSGEGSFDLRAEDIHLQTLRDQVLVMMGSTSSIYRYDPAIDSLRLITFPHQLTAREKEGEYPNEVSSSQEYQEIVAAIQSQITYDKMVWDQTRQSFFRLGTKKTASQPNRYEIFLYVYNPQLELIGESLLGQFDTAPSTYFFKDGKLWSYVNVEDELGFAVFTFDF